MNSTIHPTYGFPVSFSAGISANAVTAAISSFSLFNSKFNKWLDACILNKLDVRAVTIDAITMFGPNIGFIYFTASVFDKHGNQMPGTVFLRGDSATCLLIAEVVDEEGAVVDHKMIVVEEVKVPVSQAIMQPPSGMLDDSNNIKGKMIDEIREECGITIQNELVYYNNITETRPPIGTLIHFDSFWPSQGGCDESIEVFAYVHQLSTTELAEIDGRITGNRAEKEIIKVHILPLCWTIIDRIRDSKLLVAAGKFDRKFPGIIRN